MAQNKRLIFKVNGLEKDYGSYQALKVKKLEIHPGTVYGIVGTVGSGKSTLLNILAGIEKESSGTVLYEDKPYETNWLGRVKCMMTYSIQKPHLSIGQAELLNST